MSTIKQQIESRKIMQELEEFKNTVCEMSNTETNLSRSSRISRIADHIERLQVEIKEAVLYHEDTTNSETNH